MVIGDPHGVPTYGYTQKWEDFPVVFENQLSKWKYNSKNFWFLWVQELFQMYTVSNYFGGIPLQMV